MKTNGELLEHLESTMRWLLHHCEKNGINLPNEYQLRRSVERAQELIQKLPTNQPIVNTNNNSQEDNSTYKIKSYILRYFIVR